VPYAAEVLADAPDVYLRLDETGSGPFVDVVAGNDLTPDGAIVSAASLLASDPDASATFDYTTTLTKAVSAYTVAQQPMTIELWVKPISLTGSSLSASIVASCSSGANGWSAKYRDTTGAWRFTTHGVKDYDFTAAASIGVTQHVVFVFQASNAVDLYINGVFQQTVTHGVAMTATTSKLTVAGFEVGTSARPKATIDEVAVYKSALSAARIAAHYQAGNDPAAATTGVSFGASGSITAPTSITPASSGVVFSGSGSITTGTVPFISGTAGVSFSGAGALTAPTLIVFSTSGIAFGATGSVTAPASLTPAPSGVSFSATGSVTAAPRISGTGSVTFTGTGAISAPLVVAPVKGYALAGDALFSNSTGSDAAGYGSATSSVALRGALSSDVLADNAASSDVLAGFAASEDA
jgi:hypothetical protein